MWVAVETAFSSILTLMGTFITALTSSSGALYPLLALFAVGISISLVMVAVKIVRKITWGA